MSNKAHKHAKMIKAKADNMELVVFCKDSYDETNEWQETSQFPFQEEFNYFLCLPQHKEACLHWLGGNDIDCKHELNGYWTTLTHTGEKVVWGKCTMFMSGDCLFRIKPRKEKRYVVVTDELAMPRLLKECDLDEAKEIVKNATFHEIEVEV